MMAELIDRRRCKAEARDLLSTAQVSPKAMAALYLGLLLALSLIEEIGGTGGILSTFLSVLTSLLSLVLGAGFTLYCMALRRGERSEFLTLFDGFSFVGRLILLELLEFILVFAWSLLFVIPGIIAVYRYQFAVYNLYENPEIGVLEALSMSKRQTMGYKSQLFMLDLSYIGWTLLADLPSIVMQAVLYRTVAPLIYTGEFWDLTVEEIIAMATPLTPITWLLIAGLWALAVGIFYRPGRTCVTLAYFETAKRTSGIGEGVEPPRLEDNGWSNW